MTDTAAEPAVEDADKRDRPSILQVLIAILQVLIVALTVLTAWAAYLGVLADDTSAGLELEGEQLLSEAQRAEAEVDRLVLEQFRLFDEYVVSEPDSFAEEYYLSQLDKDVRAAAEFNRTVTNENDFVDPFSQEYVDSAYADAFGFYDESAALFEESTREGDMALGYQRALFTFAIGLSFAAWGGLVDEDARGQTRLLFIVLSIAAAVVGLVQFISV